MSVNNNTDNKISGFEIQKPLNLREKNNHTDKKKQSIDFGKLFASYDSGKLTENSRLLSCLIETLGVKHDEKPSGETESPLFQDTIVTGTSFSTPLQKLKNQ